MAAENRSGGTKTKNTTSGSSLARGSPGVIASSSPPITRSTACGTFSCSETKRTTAVDASRIRISETDDILGQRLVLLFSPFPGGPSRPQQRLDGPPLVHGAIAFGHLRERQRQVEHLARVDCAVEDEADQFGQITPHGRRTTQKPD